METQIIDFHTHIYPVALARRAMEVVRREGDPYDSLPIRENLLRRMEEADISLSVVQPVVSRPETQTDVNRFAREIVRTNLISFGGLHPDCPHVLEEIEKLKDLHMAGVKFHPPFQKVHLEDGKYREIWERINHLGLPVLIHCGCAKVPSPYDLHPASAEEIVRHLPDVPVILAHMGGLSMDQTGEDRLYRMPENVYIDTAMSAEFQDKDEFERIAGSFGPDLVIFGSDFPYGSQRAAIRLIEETGFSPWEKAAILGENARKILKDSIRKR